MPPKKKIADETAPKGRTIIRVKQPHQWNNLIRAAREKHWRRLRVTVQLREWLMAGKPAHLDAAHAMLKARGLEDQIEAVSDIEDPELRKQAAERIAVDEGLCEFSRRPGKSGIWLPCNNLKAGFKENWSVLGMANMVRGSRKAIAEGVFIFCDGSWDKPSEERDWVYLGEAPDLHPDTGKPYHTAVSHSVGPRGPVSSIKRHEFVNRARFAFEVYVAQYSSVEDKISDDDVAAVLVHWGEHGMGACRSQGYGKFDIVEVCELESTATTPESSTVPESPMPSVA